MKRFMILFLLATPILTQAGYDQRKDRKEDRRKDTKEYTKELRNKLMKGLKRESKKEWSELRGLAGKSCNVALALFQCDGIPQNKIQKREKKICREN